MSGPEQTPDFFEAYAEFCDLVWTGGQRRDTSFYLDVANEAGAPVLECGCGTGALVRTWPWPASL